MSGKMIVAGHLCLDITPVFSSENAIPLSKVLIPGRLLQMKDISISTGGVVANTGLALKFLGADVDLMGKIGNDELGGIVLKKMEEHQAAEGMIISEDCATSYTVVIAPPGTDRIFLHNPGANDAFTCDDLDFDRIKGAAWFHFGYPPLMKSMYVDGGGELVRIFRKVKELGVPTSLDMAAVDPDSSAGEAAWEAILEEVLPFVDYFVPSIEELGYMADRPLYEEWAARSDGRDVTEIITLEGDVKPLADRVMELGAKNVLIKCGVSGMYFQNKTYQIFEKSYKPERVLSGTGAGDASIAAFLKAVLDGFPIPECLRLAAGTGASCVEAYDALSGLRTFEELRRKIDAGWKKQV